MSCIYGEFTHARAQTCVCSTACRLKARTGCWALLCSPYCKPPRLDQHQFVSLNMLRTRGSRIIFSAFGGSSSQPSWATQGSRSDGSSETTNNDSISFAASGLAGIIGSPGGQSPQKQGAAALLRRAFANGAQDSNCLRRSNFSRTTWLEQCVPASVLPYVHLARMHKPIGAWLLAWPCFWSIAMAAAPGQLPDLYMLTLYGTGAVVR